MEYTILEGSALEVLKTLEDELVQVGITSPPYFGLREYNAEGQIGQESELDCLGWATGNACGNCYICHLVEVFREFRRVLRSDGLLWVNIGDSYYNHRPGGVSQVKQSLSNHVGAVVQTSAKRNKRFLGIKEKDMMLVPFRLALAMQADGWYIRNDNIWAKPNCMPASVRDRNTLSHEYFFCFSKQLHYFYDQDAIREPFAESTLKGKPDRNREEGSAFVNGTSGRSKQAGGKKVMPNPKGRNRWTVWNGISPNKGSWDFCTNCNRLFVGDERKTITKLAGFTTFRQCSCGAINKFESHFATFPYKLVEIPVKASIKKDPLASRSIVLDPFSGSGSTGVVAVRNGANYIGIEINPTYAEISRQRIAKDGIGCLTTSS